MDAFIVWLFVVLLLMVVVGVHAVVTHRREVDRRAMLTHIEGVVVWAIDGGYVSREEGQNLTAWRRDIRDTSERWT
jgi:hypothetical protein